MERRTLASEKSKSPFQAEREKENFRLWVQRQFTERCRRNPRYSLRAFAKVAKVDASSLLQIMHGKRPVSKRKMRAICDNLAATPKDLERCGLGAKGLTQSDEFHQLSLDTFAAMSDWYHYAVLELTHVSGFKADSAWIARKLGITVEEAKTAVARLIRLGLLIENDGILVKSNQFLTNESAAKTSAAHRELQRQLIKRALMAVDESSPEEKDITSITMAINLDRLEQARGLIRQFRRELCALLEDGEQERVYNLTIQLFPASRKEDL